MKKSETILKCWRLRSVLIGLGIIILQVSHAQSGTLDQSFNPGDLGFLNGTGANSTVQAIVEQPDGKVLIGGSFTTYNGVSRNGIARLNADGSLDTSFNPGTGLNSGGLVGSIALQSDGKIVIGGSFSAYAGVPINNIARLNGDGSIDLGFQIGTGANGEVYKVAVTSNNKILFVGPSSFNGTSINRLARLNSDGSLDGSFISGAGSNFATWTLAVQPDDKVLIGIWRIVSGSIRNEAVRLNSDGSIDTSFNLGTGGNNSVRAISVQSDGKIVLGGYFTNYNGFSRNRIVRLNADGTVDASFNPGTGASSFVNTIFLQSDGRILVGGIFTSFNGAAYNRIIRLNIDGSIDFGFDVGSGANNSVLAIAQQSNGQVLLGGNYTSLNGVAKGYVSRLNADASLDFFFNPGTGADGQVQVIRPQMNGKIVLAGDFVTYNGSLVNRITRILSDGSLDPTFNAGSGANNIIRDIQIQADGKILLCGDFTEIDHTPINRIARLNADGSLDTSFDPGTGPGSNIQVINSLNALAIRPDGKILVAGTFSGWAGWAFNRMVLLNADGSLDNYFNRHPITTGLQAGANGTIRSMVLQPDGKILIGGDFLTYNTTPNYRVARLEADGNLDITFNTGFGANAQVYELAVQSDGKVLIGGAFSSFAGCNSCVRIGRLNADGTPDNSFDVGTGATNLVKSIAIQSDHKILLGGSFTSFNGYSANRLVRINTDGSIDNSFNIGSGADASLSEVALRSDEKLLIGGDFVSYNGVGRTRLALINTSNFSVPTVITDSINAIGSDSAVVFASVTSDGGSTIVNRGIVYSNAANPTLTDSTISLTGSIGSFSTSLTQLQPNTTYYVRAFATNSVGTAYGNEVSFSTPPNCNLAFNPNATNAGNYRVNLTWNSTGATTYGINLRPLGDTQWQTFLSTDTSRILQNRAPGDYEYYIVDLDNGDSSCVDQFSVNCATDITYTFNAFQAPELGRLGRVRVFGTQGGKRLYDIHLVNEEGDSNSALNVRQRNYTDLPAGDYSLYVRDDFGCEAASVGQFTINAMDTNFIPNLINAPNNPPNGFRPTWHSVAGVINYQLRVVNVTDGTLQDFVTGITDTSYAVTNLPAGKLYRFNVRSRYNDGTGLVNSGYSNAVSRNLPVVGNKGEPSGDEGIASGTTIDLIIYPNPTNGMLYIQGPVGRTLTLIDLNGKAIAQRTATGVEEIIDMTDLAQGVYILEVNSGGQLYRERIVKQ